MWRDHASARFSFWTLKTPRSGAEFAKQQLPTALVRRRMVVCQ
jgi:hypothetical protein